MSTDSNFETLVQSLKLDEPWLPPKPWESVPSESGHLRSTTAPCSSSRDRLYDLSSVSEASLVRLVMHALEGVQSAIISAKMLSESFCADPADRSFHRIPSLWNRALSTNALGKMLKSIGFTGSLVLLLYNFVEHFTTLSYNTVSADRSNFNSEPLVDQTQENGGVEKHHSSLVNQAFAVAVEKVLQGYILALNTVNASAFLRRWSLGTVEFSSKASQGLGDGNLTSIVHSETTVFEVYLHTKEMTVQMEVLGNLCGVYNAALSFSDASLEDMTANAKEEFYKFPRGGDLLTFLYNQLLVADPAHSALLKFLFCQSLEPYLGFIRSWIYEAKICDPYKEFIIECEGNIMPLSHGKTGIPVDFPFATVRVCEKTVAPCFLKNFTIPLLRAGQQLQVVLKLLELCKYSINGDYTVEDILPNCNSFSGENLLCASVLCFNNKDIDDILISRKQFYRMIFERLEYVMKNFDIKYHQVSLGVASSVPFDPVAGNLDTVPLVLFDESLISPAAGEERALSDEDSEPSSIEEFSYATDPWESSECLSADDVEDQNGLIHPNEQIDSSSGMTQSYLSILSFSTGNTVEQSLKAEKPHHEGSNDLETPSLKEISGHSTDPLSKETLLRDKIPLYSGTGELLNSQISGMQFEISEPYNVWPLGGLMTNPLDRWTINAAVSRVSESDHLVSSFNSVSLEDDTLCQSNQYVCKCVLGDDSGEVCNTDQAVTKTHPLSISCYLQSWNYKGQFSTHSINPMLTRNTAHVDSSGNKETPNISCSFPCFNFSSLADPLEKYTGKPYAVCDVPSGFTESVGSAAKSIDKGRQNKQSVGLVDQKIKSSYGFLNSKNVSLEIENADLKNVSGGSGWETLLHGHRPPTSKTFGSQQGHGYDTCFEIPLDFVIHKCLLQEIQLQYHYVSRLTIMLLEEGFDLREHLLTLRRYHFMEIADWANLFIMCLWRHKWCFKKADQSIPEIQGLLESSIQRSSCETDSNKDRLYIYVKDHDVAPVSPSAIGIRSFNFIGLGYRVDWPISIILNTKTLKMYSEIFSFLIQVKLAVSSSTQSWCLMKELKHILSQPSQQPELELSHFNSLVKLRHQVHHFVATLEQYVLSQLSDVSWCRLQKSLEHQVKDLMDIESVHMAYLTDSMNICFLADETQSTSNTIQSILQCALDFHSCLARDFKSGGSYNGNLAGNSYSINILEVLSLKRKFDQNLKQLHWDYLKCSKHSEVGLARFWSYLNYNEYYSDTAGSITFNRGLIV